MRGYESCSLTFEKVVQKYFPSFARIIGRCAASGCRTNGELLPPALYYSMQYMGRLAGYICSSDNIPCMYSRYQAQAWFGQGIDWHVMYSCSVHSWASTLSLKCYFNFPPRGVKRAHSCSKRLMAGTLTCVTKSLSQSVLITSSYDACLRNSNSMKFLSLLYIPEGDFTILHIWICEKNEEL